VALRQEVGVPPHLLPVLARLAQEGLHVVARRDGDPGPEAAELVADLKREAQRYMDWASRSARVRSSDVGGAAGRDSEPVPSSGGMTSKQLAAALRLGVRHAQDVARSFGVRSWPVGRSRLWDVTDVERLVVSRRGSEDAA
jgi:hypothetical protein